MLQRVDGSPVHIQSVEGGLLLDIGYLPPYSVTPLSTTSISNIQYPIPNLTATQTLLENDYLRVELDTAGDIVRIYVENAQPVEYGEHLFAIRPATKK